MEDSLVYGKVAVELIEIFYNLDISIFYKIPSKLIEKLESIRDKEYYFKYDRTKELEEQNILKETKELFSSIYLEYCCDEQTRQELLGKCSDNDSVEETYNYDALFKHNKVEETENVTEEVLPTVVKETFWSKILNNIRSFFYKFSKKK